MERKICQCLELGYIICLWLFMHIIYWLYKQRCRAGTYVRSPKCTCRSRHECLYIVFSLLLYVSICMIFFIALEAGNYWGLLQKKLISLLIGSNQPTSIWSLCHIMIFSCFSHSSYKAAVIIPYLLFQWKL